MKAFRRNLKGFFVYFKLKFKFMPWLDRMNMTKQEVATELKSKGQFDTNTRNELWIKAFQLYEKETRQKLSLSCGSCYTKIRAWLQA